MSDGLVAKQKGDVVDGYRILGEIGRGAASIIYLTQEESTKQVRALKHVQKQGPKDDRFIEQAEMEYRISSELDHPALRKIYRIIKKGTLLKVRELFLVMELVDGSPMDKRPPETFESALSTFAQVARGMAHMHERGFVHADMKPQNIIVSAENVAKVIDLGQSCKIGTVKERIQGTPDYIAPEQVHRRPILPATDVYNLGATMYWVLTRQKIPTALAKEDSLIGRLDDHLIEKPKEPRAINARIPDRLNDLIMRCIEVDALSRPGTMTQVAESLEFVHGQMRAKRLSAKPARPANGPVAGQAVGPAAGQPAVPGTGMGTGMGMGGGVGGGAGAARAPGGEPGVDEDDAIGMPSAGG